MHSVLLLGGPEGKVCSHIDCTARCRDKLSLLNSLRLELIGHVFVLIGLYTEARDGSESEAVLLSPK